MTRHRRATSPTLVSPKGRSISTPRPSPLTPPGPRDREGHTSSVTGLVVPPHARSHQGSGDYVRVEWNASSRSSVSPLSRATGRSSNIRFRSTASKESTRSGPHLRSSFLLVHLLMCVHSHHVRDPLQRRLSGRSRGDVRGIRESSEISVYQGSGRGRSERGKGRYERGSVWG